MFFLPCLGLLRGHFVTHTWLHCLWAGLSPVLAHAWVPSIGSGQMPPEPWLRHWLEIQVW